MPQDGQKTLNFASDNVVIVPTEISGMKVRLPANPISSFFSDEFPNGTSVATKALPFKKQDKNIFFVI
jgi:hypothetical protein